VRNRPGAQKGVDLGKEWRLRVTPSDKERKTLFNPTAPAVLGHGGTFAHRYWIFNVSAVACEVVPLLPVIWTL
jgi:hypothetical protein